MITMNNQKATNLNSKFSFCEPNNLFVTLLGREGVQCVGAAQCGRGADQAQHGGPPQQRDQHLQLPQQGGLWPRHHRGQVRQSETWPLDNWVKSEK